MKRSKLIDILGSFYLLGIVITCGIFIYLEWDQVAGISDTWDMIISSLWASGIWPLYLHLYLSTGS